MIQATKLRKGMAVKYESKLHVVLTAIHKTPGNLRGFVQAKLRNVESGSQCEVRFAAEDMLEPAMIDQQPMEFLYTEGDSLIFMNQDNYEQVALSKEFLADTVYYLLPNTNVKVNFCDGRAIGIDLPTTVDLKIVETEPGLKGATVTNVYKPAKLETGLVVQVPPFLSVGEVIRVDTREGTYVGRSN